MLRDLWVSLIAAWRRFLSEMEREIHELRNR